MEFRARTVIEARANVAEQAGVETVGERVLSISPEDLPWIDSPQDVCARIVDSPYGTFLFGNIIGDSKKLQKVATDEMRGQQKLDDRLNRLLYDSIQEIMRGSSFGVKRLRNSPVGTDIYYNGLTSGARVFFVDKGRDGTGLRTFLKAAVCQSKEAESYILSTFSGKKNERVK